MNARERVMAVLDRRQADRLPCFGANATVTYEQMEAAQAFWPEGHEKGETMARQALAAFTVIGFDAVRVPFSQTFEAEALGCRIKPGSSFGGQEGIPGIDEPHPYRLEDEPRFPADFLSRGKIPELLKAVRLLRQELAGQGPVIGGIIGPFTVAGALLGLTPLLKATVRAPQKLRPFLEVAEKAGTALALALVEAGADIIACEDMTASPLMIPPKTYREMALEYQARQFAAIPVPKILHICGNVELIAAEMAQSGADVLSLEPKTGALLAREKCGPQVILMGGVDVAKTLFMGTPEEVREECQRAVGQGIQILAPGCAVAPATPSANLRAMVEAARCARQGDG